eukprot:TRINITY_DN40586_c0_g1_i1.p1 TRINITY_DN40586_c0_g1~~TRINITY_DN40586_c0_g1_i1.p1  ORF type:complete len:236 (-),score=47.35 TRINITY_DN40586_c0_g1_i1:255-962(-)
MADLHDGEGVLSGLQLTLYHMAPTRSARVVWLAHELGIASHIDIEEVNLMGGEHKKGRPFELNRMGAIPILHIVEKESAREVVMTESAAICDLLLLAAGEERRVKLMPRDDDLLAMAAYRRFCTFAVASMDSLLWVIRQNEDLLDEEKRAPKAAQQARREFAERVVPVLEQRLADTQYICEPERTGFSAADIMVGYSLAWASKYGLLEGSRLLRAYLQRVSARKAFATAMRRSRA